MGGLTSATSGGFSWLTLLGGLPLLGVVAILFLPKDRPQLVKLTALVTAIVTFVVDVWMSALFHTGGALFQYVTKKTWIASWGVHYELGADGIALVLIGLTTLLVPIVILASWDQRELGRRSPTTYFVMILLLETLMIGAFASLDVFLFYIFFEAMLVPMYFIIGSPGSAKSSYAAVNFLLYSLLGGLLMLASVIGLYVAAAQHLPGGGTFDYTELLQVHNHISPTLQGWLFAGFMIAFAIKAPLWPLHTWLPDAADEAPTGGAVLLVGVMDKVGTFGMIRYCLPLFPHAASTWGPVICGFAVVSILYGALLAIGQRDLKRLIAYTSVSHFGFIVFGIFAFTQQGGAGATLYMVNHGFSTAGLFLIVGFMATRRGSNLIEDYGGMGKVAPWLAGVFLVAGLSSLALPGLNSFVSEIMVFIGTFLTHRALAVAAVFGIVLASLYILIMYQRTMHGPVRQGVEGARDLTRREAWVIAPVIGLIIALGFYPKPLLDAINPAVAQTLHLTGVRDHQPSVASPEEQP
ncbi:MAG TPA: NADH-quinone oxidoreductase subunit M [Mycobacteriales bacterium]|nr:NADH-quinone oxidoreductase subunit M [Mycobacteriales bacterium]